MRGDVRGQSEAIGVILLVSVIVVSVTAYGVFYLSSVTNGPNQSQVMIEQTGGPPNITLTHAGGETLGNEAFVVVTINGEQRDRPTIPSPFGPGDEISINTSEYGVGPGDVLSVDVYDGDTRVFTDEWAFGRELLPDPPNAFFTISPAEPITANTTVTFDATGSFDPDGDIESYDWSFEDGSTDTGDKVTRKYAQEGDYTVTLNVTDRTGRSDSFERTVTITAESPADDSPPSVTLQSPSGTQPRRADDPITVEWRAEDPESGVDSVDVQYTTDGGDSWTEIATGRDAVGSYEWVPSGTIKDVRVRVRATNGEGFDGQDRSDSFTIDGDEPNVNVSTPRTPEYTQSGEDVTVSWNTSDATTGVDRVNVRIENDTTTIANTTETAADGSTTLLVPDGTTEGNYSVVVDAVDAVGNTRTVDRGDAVVVDDTSPALTLQVQDESNERCFWIFCSWNEEYQYQWSSSDASPYDVSFSAERGEETLATSTQESGSGVVTPESRRGATYRFVLTATDRAGNTETVEITDTRGDPDRQFSKSAGGETKQSPIATLAYDTASPMIDETVSFDAGASEDPDGGDVSYEWSFGDGSTNQTGVSPSHAYDSAGTYTVTLTVTDDEGQTDTATEQVNVGYALNAGGPEWSGGGETYAADNGENEYLYGPGTTSGTTDEIANTDRDTLYQSIRYGEFGYAIPAQDGEYRITIQVAETYWVDEGRRVFDVLGEGSVLVDDLDIYAEVGHDQALVLERTVTVTDGTLNVEFEREVDNALLGALHIERIGAAEGGGGGTDELRSANTTVSNSRPAFRHPT